MTFLILGLIIFLGMHSIRIVADDWRSTQLSRYGEKSWKAGYSILSIIGFVLIIWGFGLARLEPIILWTPPAGMLHLTALLVLIAFILIAAAYVPRNGIKARLHHPMMLGIQLWALGHLLANGTLADVILFGCFLVWGIFSFRAARQRDQIAGTSYPAGTLTGTIVTIIAGLIVWAAFAFWLHTVLIGVPLFN